MGSHTEFATRYAQLEGRLRAMVEREGSIYVPNAAPVGPVQFVLVCMEPSLGRWAGASAEAQRKLPAGLVNFVSSVEDFILHFCVKRYLCGDGGSYHITDMSKGAMLVRQAGFARAKRYAAWHRLLEEEIDLVATADARIIAVGGEVARHLRRCGFRRRYEQVIHYSGQAASARIASVRGREREFDAFSGTVSVQDVRRAAEEVLERVHVAADLRERMRRKMTESVLTPSRQRLIFAYKCAFEAMRGGDRSEASR